MQELIDSGAEIDTTADNGETPLHVAAANGHQSVVEVSGDSLKREREILCTTQVLLDAGASKRIRDNKGNRPSSVVCSRADPKCTSATESAIEDLVAR